MTGGTGSYGSSDHTSSMPTATAQPNYPALSGQGVSYTGTSQGTPSFSGSGNADPYSGGQVSSSPTTPMTGGTGSYGSSDHTSSMPTATAQPNYPAPSGQGINYPSASHGTPSTSGGGNYDAYSGGKVSSSPTTSMTGGTGSYGSSDHTSSMPTATAQPNYPSPSGVGINYPGASQGTPSLSGSGSPEAYSGTKVTSATPPMTGGNENYGGNYQTSSTPTGTAQPSYTASSGSNILSSDSSIPMSQTGADFRAEAEKKIHSTQQDIQIGASEIRKNADPVKQKVNAAQGTSIHNNLKKKLGEESLQSIQDAYEYLTDKKNITGEK